MARCETRGGGEAGPRRRYDYLRPGSLGEALRLAEEDGAAQFVAGGTDVMARLHAGTLRTTALISLRGIDELHELVVDDGGARIGALTTIAELIEHAALAAGYPVLVAAARRMGGPQIRNAATVGGNICNASPCADTAPPLLVLGARVQLSGRAGSRELPLERFFLGPGATALAPGEILTRITLPPPAPGAAGVFFKQGRVRMDLALVSAAVLVARQGPRCTLARVAVGSVAPVPLRLATVEALLEGHELDDHRIAAAAEAARAAISPLSDLRASAGYRRQLLGVALRRTLEQLRAVAPDASAATPRSAR